MAAPLFVTSEALLKSKLRLSAVPAAAVDTEAIFDEAVLRARVKIYRALGETRVAEILATPFTETPTTEAQVIRALASNVEVKIVYCTLLRLLPNAFMDASGDVHNRWNEEAPFRERGPSPIEMELIRCENEIASDLVALADPSESCSDVQVYDGTPDCPAPRVGLSLKLPANWRTISNDPS